MSTLYLMFVLVALGAIVAVCLGLIALGAYGTLWLIGHGHMEVKIGTETEEDAGEAVAEEAEYWRLARRDAVGQGHQGRADARARGIRLHQPGRRGDHD